MLGIRFLASQKQIATRDIRLTSPLVLAAGSESRNMRSGFVTCLLLTVQTLLTNWGFGQEPFLLWESDKPHESLAHKTLSGHPVTDPPSWAPSKKMIVHRHFNSSPQGLETAHLPDGATSQKDLCSCAFVCLASHSKRPICSEQQHYPSYNNTQAKPGNLVAQMPCCKQGRLASCF